MLENVALVSWLGGYGEVKGREERKPDHWMLLIHCTLWTASPRDTVNAVIQMDLGRRYPSSIWTRICLGHAKIYQICSY